MKIFKTTTLIIVSLLFLITSSCNFKCVDPVGPVISDSRLLEDFTGLDIRIPANVKIMLGDEPGIVINAQESYVNAISTNISRGKLMLLGDVCKADNSEINIVVTAPDIEYTAIRGSADVYSDNPLKSDDLKIKIEGSGSVYFDIFSNEVVAEIAGSGNIILVGTCDNLEVDIDGSGDFKGAGLNTFSSRAEINGSGTASVVAHNKLNATVVGSGVIDYTGNPEINISISGSGTVNKIN